MHDYWLRLTGAFFDGADASDSNDNDATNPEVWAQEALALLEENMVMANLVYRDFEDEVAEYGDTINTRIRSTFKARRKVDTEDVDVQAAISTKVPVVMNQHIHTSFMLKDGEMSRSFADLVRDYLAPAVLSIAQEIDMILLGQAPKWAFVATEQIGVLGTVPTGVDFLLDARNVLNKQLAPMDSRSMILTPNTETALLKLDTFHEADKMGDAGTAMREASLGKKFGFNTFMCQNTPDPSTACATGTATWTDTLFANAAKGATSIYLTTCDVATLGVTAGDTINVAGDPQLVIVVGAESSTDESTLTIYPGLRRAAVATAVVTGYNFGLFNGAEVIGWHGDINIDTVSLPVIGQPIMIHPVANTAAVSAAEAAALYIYTITYVDTAGTTIRLDRPLEIACADNSVVSFLPLGQYNFGFHKNALAMVTRPLAKPLDGVGALSAIASYNGLGIRIVMTYNGNKQGHLVTVDLLMGVKTLREELAVCAFS